MAQVTLTFKSLEDPSASEVAAVKALSFVKVVNLRHGVAVVDVLPEKVASLKRALPNWKASPLQLASIDPVSPLLRKSSRSKG